MKVADRFAESTDGMMVTAQLVVCQFQQNPLGYCESVCQNNVNEANGKHQKYTPERTTCVEDGVSTTARLVTNC